MADFNAETWVILGVVAGAGVVTVLGVLASVMAHEQRVHELRIRVAELRRSYADRLARLNAEETLVVDVAPDQD